MESAAPSVRKALCSFIAFAALATGCELDADEPSPDAIAAQGEQTIWRAVEDVAMDVWCLPPESRSARDISCFLDSGWNVATLQCEVRGCLRTVEMIFKKKHLAVGDRKRAFGRVLGCQMDLDERKQVTREGRCWFGEADVIPDAREMVLEPF